MENTERITLGGIDGVVIVQDDGEIWITFEDGVEVQLLRPSGNHPLHVNGWVNEGNTDSMTLEPGVKP